MVSGLHFQVTQAQIGRSAMGTWKWKLKAEQAKNNQLSGPGWLALAAFIALSIPVALVPPQFLVATSMNPVAAATPMGSAAASPATATAEAERTIVVSIPDRKLAVVEHGRVKKVY